MRQINNSGVFFTRIDYTTMIKYKDDGLNSERAISLGMQRRLDAHAVRGGVSTEFLPVSCSGEWSENWHVLEQPGRGSPIEMALHMEAGFQTPTARIPF